MKRILVVEDEASIRELVALNLKMTGWEVLEAPSAERALELIQKNPPCDVALLDIMLPGMDGFSLCETIRHGDPYIGIIMASAKGQESDKIRGLSIGADDYIVKPFSPGEVMARIRAVLRRIPAAAEKEMLVIGELSIHLPSLSATLSGHKLNLTRREVELLYTLAASPGRVFTRDNLLTIVWGYEFAGNYRAVDSHIKRLRAKLDAYPHDTFTIATVWGAGYKFERNLP